MLKKLLAFIIILNTNQFGNLNASELYDIPPEEAALFTSLRRCYFSELKHIRNGSIQQVRDNLSLFFNICAVRYPGKVTLELLKQDTTDNLTGVTASSHQIAVHVITEAREDSSFTNSPFKNFANFRFLNDYELYDSNINQISAIKELMDASPYRMRTSSALAGMPKKLQRNRFYRRNADSIEALQERSKLLAQALRGENAPLAVDAAQIQPKIDETSTTAVAATFTRTADGTMPFLRMKTNFAAKVPSKAEIKAKLQRHIIGQDDAMDEMAMLGYQILLEKAHVEADSTWRFRAPHKLVFGGTGTGKTFSVRKLAEILGIPFVEVNAPALVGEGYVGTPLSAQYIPLKKAMGVEKFAIIFLDEIGKMCATKWGDAVMKILLSHMNGINVGLPKDNETLVNTSCFTYIGADACSGLGKPISDITVEDLTGPNFGMTQELLARFTGIIRLQPHNEESLLRILKDAQDGPYNHARESFKRTFETENGQKVELEIADSGLLAIAAHAFKSADGARVLEEVFGKVMHPLVAEPNQFIERFNAFKKAEREENAKATTGEVSAATANSNTSLKIKKKPDLGYSLEFSEDGSTIKWIIDEGYVTKHLPKMLAREEVSTAWQSMFM